MVIQGGARATSTSSDSSTSGVVSTAWAPSPRIIRRSPSTRRSFADHALGPEAGDGLASIAQDTAQDSLRVLAQGRGWPGLADLALGANGARHLPDAAEVRMLDLDDHLAGAYLLVLEGLRHGIDGSAWHVAAEEAEPRSRRLLREARLEDLDQLRLVGEALGEAREPRIIDELRQLHPLDESLPELVLVAEDDDPPVPRGEVLSGNEGLVARVRDALRLPVTVQRPDGKVGQHAHRGVEEGHVHIAPHAGALRLEEADHPRVAAREVDDADSALAGRAVRLAGDAHVACVALDQVVEARFAGSRPTAPETAQRAAHDARVHALEGLVGQAETGGEIAAHVIEEGVRNLDQIVQHRAPGLMLQVEGERLRATVEGLEVERVLLVEIGRNVARAVATHRGVLDLDDLRAQVSQHLGTERASSELGDGEDADAGERGSRHVSREACPRRGWRGSSSARGPCGCRSRLARRAGCSRWSPR